MYCTYMYCISLCIRTLYGVQVPHKYIGSDNGHYLHEEEPQDMKVGISIRNLVKIYNIVSGTIELIILIS